MIEHVEYTAEQLRAQQQELATAVGIASVAEAYRQLDDGELEGTILAAELDMLRFLLEGPRR
jgi:hypothetical protein